ncbi:MAG: hypothetical protein RL208_124 [Pseudomonadota bacterium]|jgi:prepilin-type N-terminal cleavage/methylation domain-containing protein
MKKYYKQGKNAFTLVELSVVLIVLSILIGSVLVSRKIIDRSRGQALMTEVRQMKQGIRMFSDGYGAMPGDVTAADLVDYADLSQRFTGYASNTTNKIKTGAGKVELAASCYGMRMLELTGFVNGVPNASAGGALCDYSTLATLQNQTKKAKFSSDVGVFFADGTLYGNAAGAGARYILSDAGTDMSVGYASSISMPSIFQELRSANSGTAPTSTSTTGGSLGSGIDLTYYTNLISIVNVRNFASGAVSSSVAKYLDVKTDDGKPLTGKVVAGAHPVNVAMTSSQGLGSTAPTARAIAGGQYCHSIAETNIAAGGLSGTAMANATYQTVAPDSLERGCNVFVLVN